MSNTRRHFLGGGLALGMPCLAFTPLVRANSVQMSPNNTARPPASKLIEAARSQIGVTTLYDGAYRRLSYPNGDFDRKFGVCTDVIIRAYRDGLNYDFQHSVHTDMKTGFQHYPANWGLTKPDSNIDHRRVPNLETYLHRQKAEYPPANWQPGDIVTMRLSNNLPHIAIISDTIGPDGTPKVIHNIGRGTYEESLLGQFSLERRFRYLPTG